MRDGYWSGYGLYRYGSPRKVTSPSRILRGVARERVIDHVVTLLRRYRLSPFEYEGPARAGLRAGFCLEGNRWALSDIEAEEIVAEGLRRIGVKRRPTLAEGQREYTASLETCLWCGDILEDAASDGRRVTRFCSTICANSALLRRRTVDNYRETSVGESAYRMVQRATHKARECARCGGTFRRQREADETAIYCSPTCSTEAMKATAIIVERQCAQCSATFKPQNSKQAGKFCSRQCRISYEKVGRFENTCRLCGETFRSKREQSSFCSLTHRKAFSKRKAKAAEVTGAHVVHRLFDEPTPSAPLVLTAAAFDGFFLMAA